MEGNYFGSQQHFEDNVNHYYDEKEKNDRLQCQDDIEQEQKDDRVQCPKTLVECEHDCINGVCKLLNAYF